MADLALLLLTLGWGTSFQLVKGVLEVSPPGLFLAARFGVATLVLGAVLAVRRPRIGAGFLWHGLLLGLFMAAGFVLQTVGLQYTTPARSAFLTGLCVLLVPFQARFALGRPVRASAWVGVALAVVGLAVLTGPLAGGLGGPGSAVRLGDALSAGCAIAFALQIAYTAEWAPRHPVVPLTLVQVLVTCLGAALLLPVLGGAGIRPGGGGRFAGTVLVTGVFLTAGAFFLQNWGQRRTTAVRAALIFSLEPVFAALFSNLYGGQALGPAEWAGGGLMVLGVLTGELGGALEARRAAAVEAASEE
jgi:drug/metabolite transporter (DMT)-like permease